MAKFKVGDKVRWADQPNGKVHTVTATLSSGEVRIDGESMEFPESSFKAANSCTSTNPVVQNALAACNTDEYIIRKSLSTSKWILSKKARSLSGGEDKVFGSEQEARDFAKKNGLKIVNSSVAANAEDAGLLGALRKAKSDIGSALGKFNSHEHGDVKWAQKVNRACDDVARAINNATTVIGL